MSEQSTALLNAFRVHYHELISRVEAAIHNSDDSTVIARLGDDADELLQVIQEHSHVFEPTELQQIQTNLSLLQSNIQAQYRDILDSSHHGSPAIVQQVHTGGRGRPSYIIDPDFLAWAYNLRSTSSICRFLGVSRSTVRTALIEYGIAAPQLNPFSNPATEITSEAGASPETGHHSPPTSNIPGQVILSYTGPLSTISDSELDSLINQIRQSYPRAGITMLEGMLRPLGVRVPRSRIHQSLLRIDPVQRVFERIRIHRRTYSVPGPNSLWHHDGQHGLIRWGIIIHGFIDGYSRLIVGLRAHNNNRGQTVLDLFLEAAQDYGVPARIRGDHGVENILLAAWMEAHCTYRRSPYIWGRSVHNVRIERLWVDVTAQIGSQWHEAFIQLELQQGLDINNRWHLWLLQSLFLPVINEQLLFFSNGWNQHRIQIRNGPNRSPADLFGFDMLVHGIRGSRIPDPENLEAEMTDEELEVYGVDWEGLDEDRLLLSLRQAAPIDEAPTSWIGRVGPPDNLNEVHVEQPPVPSDQALLDSLNESISQWLEQDGSMSIARLWQLALGEARRIFGSDVF